MDLIPEKERTAYARRLLNKLKWKGSVYKISAVNRAGCRELVMELMQRLEQLKKKTEKKSHVRKRQP
jgi:GTP-binding protein